MYYNRESLVRIWVSLKVDIVYEFKIFPRNFQDLYENIRFFYMKRIVDEFSRLQHISRDKYEDDYTTF